MKEFYRVMLGRGSIYAQECREQGFIGADFDIQQDLTHELPEDWREFNKKFIPIYLQSNPGKSKVAAGLCCGFLWTVCKKIQVGDVILSPDGKGKYFVGEVQTEYHYVPGANQPHQRQVHWFDEKIDRSDMSEALRRSTGSIGTVSQISKYREELKGLIKGEAPKPVLISTNETVEDPTVFALEKHLEDFLVANWSSTPLGKTHDIYQEDDNFGQQFPTDTGPIDILAISKDKQEVLVVELKKGRASDSVVGQIQRYMGYIAEEIAEERQRVRGVIIALEDDLRIKRALKVAPNIEFYRYEVKFDLIKGK
jgi:restriction system protein